jgi:tetratricopeptide (TPR) repeat protein
VLLSATLLYAAPGARAAQTSQPTANTQIATERKTADSLYDQGKYDEAKAIYVRLVDFFRDDFYFNKRLGDCYFNAPKTDYVLAAKYFARAYELNPRDSELQMNLADAYIWSKQDRAALPLLRKIVARDPSYPQARLLLARALNTAGEFPEARSTYQSYLERWPGDRDVRLEFAALLSWNKQYSAALEQYHYILKIDPHNLQARLGEARVLSWQGPLDESLAKYNDILSYVPDNEEALRGKAFVLLWMRRYEDAGRLFPQLAKQNPGDKDIQDAQARIARWKAEAAQREAQGKVDALVQAASALASKDDYAQAIEQLSKAIALAPRDDLRFQLGEYYLWGGQKTQAIEIFQKLSAEHPDNLDMLRELGNAQAQSSRLNDAVSTFRIYLQRKQDPAVQLSLANVLRWLGKYEEAEAVYRQVLQSDPSSAPASIGLGYDLAGLGQYQQALQQLDATLRREPGNRECRLAKAQVLRWSGEHEKAIALLKAMQESQPQDPEIASILQSVRDEERQHAAEANARVAAVDVNEQIRAAQEALARDPKNPGTLRKLGELHQEKKDYKQAINYFEQALAQKPTDRSLRLELAQVSSWSGDYARSIAQYRELLNQEPGNRDYRLQVARMLSWAGDKPESIKEYRQILKDHPNDTEARQGLAQVLSWNGDYTASIAEYQQLLSQDPRNRDYRLGEARALYWSGNPKAARAILEELRTESPKDRDVGITLASIQNTLGRQDLALRQLNDLDRLRPGDTEVAQMRRSIVEGLRPVLLLRATPSVDSEDLRIYQSSATLYFHIVPQIRSYVSAGFIPSREPGGDWENARETVFGSTDRVSSWLGLRGEIGANSSSAGFVNPIGEVGITLYAGGRFQFDLYASRRFVNYVPEAVRLNISREEFRPNFDWHPDKYTTLHVDYFHQNYSNTNRNNGGNLYLTRRLIHGERFTFETGYHYYGFSFTRDIYSGFWAPQFFQEHMGIVNLSDKLTSRLSATFRSTLGVNQSHEQGAALEPFRLAGSAQVGGDYSLTDRLKFSLGAGYFANSSLRILGTSPSSGYKAYLASGSLEYRF